MLGNTQLEACLQHTNFLSSKNITSQHSRGKRLKCVQGNEYSLRYLTWTYSVWFYPLTTAMYLNYIKALCFFLSTIIFFFMAIVFGLLPHRTVFLNSFNLHHVAEQFPSNYWPQLLVDISYTFHQCLCIY